MLSVTTEVATAFEVWAPSRDGSTLKLRGGSYGELESFRLLSQETRFARGEGLPGMAWATRAPVVLDRLRVANFARTESARACGLGAGVGLPVIIGNEVQSVLTILTGRESTRFVCEVWRADEKKSELRLRDGFYGKYRGFQGISAIAKFPYGQGLPGMVWKSRMPHIIENLGASPQFWRSSEARRDGLYTGVGIPVATATGMQVVLLLSSREAPLFKACEVWKPNGRGSVLELAASSYGDAHDLRPACGGIPIGSPGGIATQVYSSQSPIVTTDLDAVERPRAHQATDAGVTTGIGYPVISGDELRAVLVMFC